MRLGVVPRMQVAGCSPSLTSLPDSASPLFSGLNQKAYLRLKLALSLNLRRQIFLAVCDDLALRNRVAARLYAELAYPTPRATSALPAAVIQAREGRWPLPEDDRSPSADAASPRSYPRLVSLNLNLSDPDPMAQIAKWLAQYPPPRGAQQRGRSPGFQILGIERLTRQSAAIQKRFLTSLQQIESALAYLESPLLLWLPRPWLHAVQQSAPAFWDWHTALFEFEGDPTPVPSAAANVVTVAAATTTATQLPATRKPTASSSPAMAAPSLPDSAAVSAHPPDPATAVSGSSQDATTNDNLWEILSQDLARLDAPAASAEPGIDSALPAALPLDVPVPTPHPASDRPPLAPVAAPTSDESLSDVLAGPTVPTAIDASVVAAASPAVVPPLNQSQAVMELADLILAAAAAATDETLSNEDAEAIQLLQHIEQLQLEEAPNAAIIAAYQNLGARYRDRIERGDASHQHLLLAIRIYEQMLAWLDESSPLWSDELNDIGNLYWMLSRSDTDPEAMQTHLDQAIAAYQRALVKTNPQTRPHSYAMIQNNLGSAYSDRSRFGDAVETLQRSVQAYEAALRYRKFEDDPARYAATQNNLGTAYWNLAQHQQPIHRLKQAIAAYFEALRYYSADREPMHYAMLQNNLGTAYWNLAQQKQPLVGVGAADGQTVTPASLLQRAIAAYRAALVYRTLEVAPAAYAATQNNLGTAFWQLATLTDEPPEQRRELLQQAIAAYKSAIAAVQYLLAASTVHAPALSFDPSATHNNLGLTYYQLATDAQQRPDEAQRSEYLSAALNHHVEALQGWQPGSELYQNAFSHVVQTVRAFYSELGSKGQSLALSNVPANLLSAVMKQL